MGDSGTAVTTWSGGRQTRTTVALVKANVLAVLRKASSEMRIYKMRLLFCFEVL